MEVSGQLNAPAVLLPGNNAGTYRIAGSVGRLWRREKYIRPTGIRAPDRPPRGVDAIPTTLPWPEGDLATIKKPDN
jgi:hypothetical protein